MERSGRSVFSGLIVITIGVVVLVFLSAQWLDYQCRSGFDNGLPVYPGATLLHREHQPVVYLLSEFSSEDSVDEISAWYRHTLALQTREALAEGRQRGSWRGEWAVTAAPDGTSIITLTVRC